ncbi:MAG: hypothetical protein HOV79_26060, partial [Hamadaea sp.]|nr:hypothetical protein [Hamadaea sp.]
SGAETAAAETTATTEAAGTTAAANPQLSVGGLVEGVRGVTASTALPGGDLLVVHSGGSLSRLSPAGDTLWRRSNLSLHTEWQVKPVRPWQPEPYAARIFLGYGPLGTTSAHSFSVGDLTGDGLPEIAFLAEVGVGPYRPFTAPGSALNTGTFLTVLDGQAGTTLWSTLLPAATHVLIADGTLMATVPASYNSQTPAADRTSLRAWRFAAAGGKLTVSGEWSVSTGSRTAYFTTLEPAGPGKVAAAWAEAYRNPTVTSHTLLIDTATGGVQWDVTNPSYARFLALDAGRDRLVGLEQRIGFDGQDLASAAYDLVTYDLATGARTLRDTRGNALPTNLLVADVADSADPEYVVNEVFFAPGIWVNTTQTRVVDGGDGSTTRWARTVKRTTAAGDGPIALGLTTAGRTVVAGQWQPYKPNTADNRTGDRYTSIIAMDGPNGTVRWSTSGDVGQPLFLTAQAGEITAVSQNQTLYRYAAGGGQVAQIVPLLGDLSSAVATDVNGDGTPDLIVGGESRGVFALDGAALATSGSAVENPKVLWRQATAGAVHQLQLTDVTGDGVSEVVVAATDAAQTLDPKTGRVLTTIDGEYVWTVTAADLDGRAGAELVVPTDAVRAYAGDGRKLWTGKPADGVRFSNAVVSDGAVLAEYNEVGGIDLAAPKLGAIAVDGRTGQTRWSVAPTGVGGGTVRGANLWNGVAAAPTLTIGSGRAVAFTWVETPAGSNIGRTQVDLRDARTGTRLTAFTDGGYFTHRGYASGDLGLLQARSAALTLAGPDGTVTHRNTLPVPFSAAFARGPQGRELVVTGNESGITAWDTSMLTTGANYQSPLLSDSTLTTSQIVVVDLDGDGVDELIGLNHDLIGMDTVVEMSGGGQYQGNSELHGLIVYRMS